jgi:hypothetical protein
MELKSTNARSSNASSRCCHTFANAQRCRLPVSNEASQFCARHAKRLQNQVDLDDAGDSSANLTAGLTEFTSAEPVNEFLSRLLLLLGQNRISPRRAAVLAYIATQILRTIAAMDSEDERGLSSPMDRLKACLERTPATPHVVEYLAAELTRAERECAAAPENNSLHSVASREYRST